MVDNSRLEQLCESSLQVVGYELVDFEFLKDKFGWVLRIFIDFPYNEKVKSIMPENNDTIAKENIVVESNESLGLDENYPVRTPEAKEEGRKNESGISLHDCEIVSRHLGTVLDVEDIIHTQYRLEVSSPGVRRPIRKERDFIRFVGEKIKVQLNEPHEGQKKIVGQLRAAGEGKITIETEQKCIEVGLANIRKANLEVDLEQLLPKGRPQKKKKAR